MPSITNALAASKYQLPEWARKQGNTSVVYGPNNPAMTPAEIGNTSVSGGGAGLLDSVGFYEAGTGGFGAAYTGGGDSQNYQGADHAGFNAWLKQTGQSIKQSTNGGQTVMWLEDADGNVTAEPQTVNNEDKKFGIAALAAAALVTAGAAGAFEGAAASGAEAATVGVGTGGGAASGAGAATGTMTAEQVALLAANGLTDAQIAAMAAAAGDTAMAASLTGAGMGGIGSTVGTSAAELASRGIGEQLAPWATSGPVTSPAAGLGPVATPSSAGGGVIDFLGNVSGSTWLDLAKTGAGLYLADKSQDAANAQGNAVTANAADTLAFSKQQYADSLPYIKAAQEKSLKVADAQLASQAQQDALAKEYADYNRTTFRPLEQGIVSGAQGYDTTQKRQTAADQALADVDMQFGARNAATTRQLAANGVSSGSPRALAILGSGGVEQARVGAGAAMQARKGVETTGFARQMDAASLGRNLPSAQATSAGLGLQAGNSAVSNSVTGANASTGQASLALSGMNSANNLSLAASQLQQRANDSQNQLWGNLGQTLGRYPSDVNMKQDIRPANAEEALEETVSTPVSKYLYNPAAMAAKGIPMNRPAGEEQTGPMAQDVQKTMGDEAAPGGKEINVGTMIGKTMLSIQALDKKVNTLAIMLQSGRMQAGVTA
jgi:hypothetical protein